MSTNALTRTLQSAYPVVIFLAVLASAGMNLVQASGPDLNHLFPHHRGPNVDRTLVSTEVSACSIHTRHPKGEHGLCPDPASSKN